LLEAIYLLDLQTIMLYPNVDAGSKDMVKVIRNFELKHTGQKIQKYKHIDFEDYIQLLKYCDCIVGNSSSGIIESSAFKLPVVNIGHRQEGRECADNVLNVDYSSEEISNAINSCLYDQKFQEAVKNCINPYGEGNSSDIICDVLKNFNISPELFSKSITYD
ncbi:MAG: UDP-N-acetylglucosamine 2-epimerase, partial [Methanogenium sp.]|nr:UDP-N-acetylglucosamine 2-epimerase [Methanogenium sp.]